MSRIGGLIVAAQGVHKMFGEHHVLKGVDLEVGPTRP